MAWATMHFATGMCCAGAMTGVACLVTRRGWRWVAPAMTVGGVWAIIPDLPRIFRQDFPNAPLASIFGHRQIESWLVDWGDVFFYHHTLDSQPKEYALAGMALIIVLYNVAILLLMGHNILQRRRLRRIANQPVATANPRQLHEHFPAPTRMVSDPQEDKESPRIVAQIHGNRLPRAS